MAVKNYRVEAGSIMQFARALGDDNPIYHDPEYAEKSDLGGIIAPPTFLQTSQHFDPDFPLRPNNNEPWMGSGAEAIGAPPPGSESGGIGLYAEHHYEYFRNIVPGDQLNTEQREGNRWEKQGKRGGTLKFAEYITEFYDQDGALVARSTIVGVQTERPVSSEEG